MRIEYFCIGSIPTQDLLISQCFLPEKERAGQAQQVWSAFLNVFQEQDWPVADLVTLPTSSPPSIAPSEARRQSGTTSRTINTASNDAVPSHVAVPLMNQQDGSCYVYKVVSDIVLVAKCPPPLAAFAPDHPVGPTSLPHSFHALVEFLDYLTRAFIKYLHPPSTTTSAFDQPSSPTSSTRAPTSPQLSAALVTANTNLVYEILDECLELGYPAMPSLQQLDLLVFGAAKV